MKRKTFRQLTATLLAMLMVVTVMAAGFPLTANAEQAAVTYTEYSWDGSALQTEVKTATDYTVVTSDLFKKNPSGLMRGTYVVNADTTIKDYFYIRKNQTVNLIVEEGATLTCKKGIGCGYDKDNQYATLNIYGSGKIITTGKKYYAGIGGRDNESSGNINIHGTTIEAKGGSYGAGIGGGDEGKKPDDNTAIKIYAGNITATAGIGGNEQPGARTYIYGGNVTAEGGYLGAGIGGGDEEGAMGIWIYGGTVNATGGDNGAGIGAGEDGGNMRKAEDGGVNILGGHVTAKGGKQGAGIGGCDDGNVSGTITIKGDDTVVHASGGAGGAGIGAGSCGTWSDNGDMKAAITIDCGENSRVYISDSIENGTVSSDKETPAEDETVTLTIAPNDGYELKTLRCKKQDGTEVELTKTDVTHYTFEMPDESVFVSAEFDLTTRLVGHSLSLKGNIGVNFYMELDDSFAESNTAYMYFTIPGDTVTYQTVYVKEQSDASLPYHKL